MELLSFEEEERPGFPPIPSCEDIVRRWLSVSQEVGSPPRFQSAGTLILDFPDWNGEENFCAVHGIALQQPKRTTTLESREQFLKSRARSTGCVSREP